MDNIAKVFSLNHSNGNEWFGVSTEEKAMQDWIMAFIRIYNRDIEGAKFKIGQEVHFVHSNAGDLGVCNVVAVKEACDCIPPRQPTFEYALDGIDFLAWESELTEVESSNV